MTYFAEYYISNVCFSACMLHTAETQFGGLCGKVVANLGSGLMECDFCLEIDIDGGKFIVFYIRSYNSFFV